MFYTLVFVQFSICPFHGSEESNNEELINETTVKYVSNCIETEYRENIRDIHKMLLISR